MNNFTNERKREFMLVKDILSNVDRSEKNIAPISSVVLCESVGIRRGLTYNWKDQTKIKAYWLGKLKDAGGRMRGLKVLYLDDRPVGLSDQSGPNIYKEKIYWVDSYAYDAVYNYLSNIILEDKNFSIPVTKIEMNDDIEPVYRVSLISEVTDWNHMIYNGKPCKLAYNPSKTKKISNKVEDQYVKIDVDGEEFYVHISELEFLFHLKSSDINGGNIDGI